MGMLAMDFSGKKMINRYEQVQLYSESEFERRRAGILQIMKEHSVQKLLFLEPCEEAYDEWLTGERFLEYMIADSDGSVIGVSQKNFANGQPSWERAKFSPLFESERCTIFSYQENHEMAMMLSSGSPQRIGVVLPDRMSAGLYDALVAALPKLELEDMSIPVALFRAVKSEEELFAIRQAREIQVAVYDAFPQMIRVGRPMREISEELQYYLMQLGASGVVHAHLICNGPQESSPPAFYGLSGDHKVKYGDRFFALMEANGPGHHHVAFGRHLLIGEPTKEWEKSVSDAEAIHRYAVSLMQPETITLRQIADKTREFAKQLGYKLFEKKGWNWMHSMGGYYYEQYSVEDYTENIPLQKNILLHCHPQVDRFAPDGKREDLMILNTYLLTETGAQDLIDVPMNIQILY